MSLSRIDAVLLFDIDLSRRRRIPDLRELLDSESKSSAHDRYAESFEWLFEAQSTPGDTEERAKDPTRRFLSQEVNCPYSPDRLTVLLSQETQMTRQITAE
jgi:hypothetical protein